MQSPRRDPSRRAPRDDPAYNTMRHISIRDPNTDLSAFFAAMRPPPEAEIPAPEFPPRTAWLNVPFLRMDRLLGRHAVLVEFWDFARVNSLRTLPYIQAWEERYGEAGLTVIGVHSPG